MRIILIGKDFSFDPWTYRFFPSELSIFLIGSLAYKYYNSYQESGNNEFVSEVGIAFILLFIISFPFIPLHYQVKKIILIISFALLIGKIFHLTKTQASIILLVCCHILFMYRTYLQFSISSPN